MEGSASGRLASLTGQIGSDIAGNTFGRIIARDETTVSKRVAQLEDDLGTRLIHRTSRRFALTESGSDAYEHAKAATTEIENARSVVQRRLAEPDGKVRMTVSVAMLHFELAHRLSALNVCQSKFNLSVHATCNFVHIVKEGFDIAIRRHFSPLANSGLLQRRLRVESLIRVASPDYLATHPPLGTPADLAVHFGLPGGTSCTSWRPFDKTGNAMNVDPRVRITVDEAFANVNTAAAGLGVTILPESYCRHEQRPHRSRPCMSALVNEIDQGAQSRRQVAVTRIVEA